MYLLQYLDRYIDRCIGRYINRLSSDMQWTCRSIVDRESTDFLVELPLMSAEVSTVTILVGYRPTTGGISVNYWQNVGRVSFDSRERVDR